VLAKSQRQELNYLKVYQVFDVWKKFRIPRKLTWNMLKGILKLSNNFHEFLNALLQ
jgi:hypothetical protein